MARLNSLPTTVNPKQMLFAINQGGTYDDLRVAHMKAIAELDLDGYAIGGLAVGESTEVMYHIHRRSGSVMHRKTSRAI